MSDTVEVRAYILGTRLPPDEVYTGPDATDSALAAYERIVAERERFARDVDELHEQLDDSTMAHVNGCLVRERYLNDAITDACIALTSAIADLSTESALRGALFRVREDLRAAL